MLVDKSLIIQILGSLMQKPQFLSEIEKYYLTPDDFPSKFEQNLFTAIYTLHSNGANYITAVDIDTYLSNHPGVYQSFIDKNGIEYLNDCEALANAENFDYYYTKLKKLNCLRDLKQLGYSIDHIYTSEPIKEAVKINEKFENLSVNDIFSIVKKDISIIEEHYQSGYSTSIAKASKNIRSLIKQLKNTPDFGGEIQGHIFNTVTRGARKGKFYIRSGHAGSNEALKCLTTYQWGYIG